ncbi:MAG: hypothetical protein QOE55_1248 [Acidobacteriaceae bacterium]|jgi:hypothetical protein|nr:hypothetical protein [Acidobacteriaceae bacterium]
MLNLRVAKPNDPIRVSELAEFVYCKRAWWLKMVQKEPSSAESREAQAEGERWHQQQGAHIARTDALSGAGYAALLIAMLLLVLAVWSRLR